MKQNLTKQMLLIIEDDEASRILIKEILSGLNIDIIETGTGKEGLYLFKKYSQLLALIFIDIQLPDYSGWELIRVLRNENYIIPIIAMSAMDPKELREKARCFGFDSYLSKPFDIEDLKRTVEFYIKRRPVTI